MRHERHIVKHERYRPKRKVLPVIERLAQTRLAWKLPVDEAAIRIGCTPATLRKFEIGQVSPSVSTLSRWAGALGFDLSLWPKGSQ